jgi:hypothetical protein
MPIPSAFLARSLTDPLPGTRKHESAAIFAVSRPAFEPITKPLADPLGFTNRAPLAVERGMATLAAKGVMVVGRGRWQFRLTLTAALPPRVGKSSHHQSQCCLLKKKGRSVMTALQVRAGAMNETAR